jgi:hypothetical protein
MTVRKHVDSEKKWNATWTDIPSRCQQHKYAYLFLAWLVSLEMPLLYNNGATKKNRCKKCKPSYFFLIVLVVDKNHSSILIYFYINAHEYSS